MHAIPFLSHPLTLIPPPSADSSLLAVYGIDFPHTTIRDNVSLQRLVLSYLGVRKVQLVIGGSLGGMIALEWAIIAGDFVRTVIPVATCARHSAWCISWSEAQRQAIMADENWKDGRYAKKRQRNVKEK